MFLHIWIFNLLLCVLIDCTAMRNGYDTLLPVNFLNKCLKKKYYTTSYKQNYLVSPIRSHVSFNYRKFF